jgi:hypothetical protein
MKRITKIVLTLILIFFIPAGILKAQGKQEEKRIKIIVADKSGTKVEIDTLIKGASPDSIKLNNGEVVVLAKDGPDGTIKHVNGEKGQMFVTVTSNEKGDKKMKKQITVISGDSAHVDQNCECCNIIIVKGGKHAKDGKGGNVVTWSSSSSSSTGGDSKGEKYIYINESKNSGKKGEMTYDVKVTKDGKGDKMEKTKYVIAKDGMVVTIEGNDEAKAKEILKDVESKLGVDKGEKNKNQAISKEGSDKTTKK